MSKRKRTNNDLQNTTKKIKIEQHEPHEISVVNSGALEVLAVPAPHMTHFVLLLNDTNIYGNRVDHQYA